MVSRWYRFSIVNNKQKIFKELIIRTVMEEQCLITHPSTPQVEIE
jgi:hypothetical protein